MRTYGDRTPVEQVVVSDDKDKTVARVAYRFRRDGYRLFDQQGRSLHPFQCLTAALENDQKTILVVPRHEQHAFLITTATTPRSRKQDVEMWDRERFNPETSLLRKRKRNSPSLNDT